MGFFQLVSRLSMGQQHCKFFFQLVSRLSMGFFSASVTTQYGSAASSEEEERSRQVVIVVKEISISGKIKKKKK